MKLCVEKVDMLSWNQYWVYFFFHWYNKRKQQLSGKTWDDRIKEIQSIDDEKCSHTTITLATTFHKPELEANQHVQFGYVPQIILIYTQGHTLESMNADPVNAK